MEEITSKKFNYKLRMLEGVLVLGLIETLAVKRLVVIMEELNYKLKVKLMQEVSVKILNMKLIRKLMV